MTPFAQADTPELDSRTLTPEQVTKNRKEWGIDLDAGTTLDRGNVKFTAGAGRLTVFRTITRYTAYFDGNISYASNNGSKFINRGAEMIRIDDRMDEHWRLFIFNANLYNEFWKLDARQTTGGGPWYDLKLGQLTMGLSLSAGYERESFQGFPTEKRARFGFRDLIAYPISATSKTGLDVLYSVAGDDLANSHLVCAAFLESDIIKDQLGLKLSYALNAESRPKPGILPSDSEIIASVALHLGN